MNTKLTVDIPQSSIKKSALLGLVLCFAETLAEELEIDLEEVTCLELIEFVNEIQKDHITYETYILSPPGKTLC